MGDIVERLRYCHDNGLFDASRSAMTAGYGEAADTIEALRAENARLQSLFVEQSDLQSEHIKCLNERWNKERGILTDEIARLREALKPLADVLPKDTTYFDLQIKSKLNPSVPVHVKLLLAARAAMGEK